MTCLEGAVSLAAGDAHGQFSDCSWYNPALSHILNAAQQGMSLSRASLAVRQYSSVVATQHGVHNGPDILKQVFLGARLAINAVESEVVAGLRAAEGHAVYRQRLEAAAVDFSGRLRPKSCHDPAPSRDKTCTLQRITTCYGRTERLDNFATSGGHWYLVLLLDGSVICQLLLPGKRSSCEGGAVCQPATEPGSLSACSDLKFESVANLGIHFATVHAHAACAHQYDHEAGILHVLGETSTTIAPSGLGLASAIIPYR